MSGLELAAAISAVAALIGVLISGLISTTKIGRMTGTMETTLRIQNETIREIKNEIAKFGDILVQIAVQRTEMDSINNRIGRVEQQLYDLARGEGWVLPLKKSPYEISGGKT